MSRLLLRAFTGNAEKVFLPATFNIDTMRIFLTEIIDDDFQPRHSAVELDFSRLQFVEPVGVVVLSNAIEFYRSKGRRIHLLKPKDRSDGIAFLDDALFFERYYGKKIFPDAAVRSSTMPLKNIHSGQAQQFLIQSIMPWIGAKVGLQPETLAGLRAAIEEILHNVQDHSGVEIGCTFAQFYPKKHEIQLAISDFGVGIPANVRKVRSNIKDGQAIELACEEGFTTKSNVRNRGAGLPNLIHWVVGSNKGTVLIASGEGQASIVWSSSFKPKLTPRNVPSKYPGTLVRVILRTDTLDFAAADAQQEVFEW